jgi:hypothetical protein
MNLGLFSESREQLGIQISANLNFLRIGFRTGIRAQEGGFARTSANSKSMQVFL